MKEGGTESVLLYSERTSGRLNQRVQGPTARASKAPPDCRYTLAIRCLLLNCTTLSVKYRISLLMPLSAKHSGVSQITAAQERRLMPAQKRNATEHSNV